MSAPTISAVVPTYNRRPYIGRAIHSILVQQPRPSEIVVIDDGSTDGTAGYLEAEFGGALRVVRQTNQGVSSARLRGVHEARGEWIAFLDSDDEWTPGRMAVLSRPLEALPADVSWVFGDTELVGDDGVIQTWFQYGGMSISSDLVILDDPLPRQYPFQFNLLQSSLIRRQALLEAGCFQEALTSSEDFLIGFRLALRSRFAALPDVVTRLYRTSDLRASSLHHAGVSGSDYFRARAIAFGEAATLRGSRPWGRLHSRAVRAWCLALAREGRSPGRRALDQFTHHVSLESIGFAAVAAFGPAGLRCWSAASEARSTLSDRLRQLRP